MHSILLIVTKPFLSVFPLLFLYLLQNTKRLVNLMFVLLFISCSLNALLKFYFQVPLHESLNNVCWWSFPSGHMQYGIVFWGMIWINSNYNLKLLGLFVFLLIGAGFSMSLHNYHTAFEMVCAIPPAIAILALYKVLLKKITHDKSLLIINLCSILFQLLTITIVKSPCVHYSFAWMWLHVGVNIGLLINSMMSDIYHQFIQKNSFKQGLFILSLVFIEGLLCFEMMTKYKNSTAQLLCGVIFPFMLYFNFKLYNKIFKLDERTIWIS